MRDLSRRDFLRYAGAGVATIVVGCGRGGGGAQGGPVVPGPDPFDPGPDPEGVAETLDFTITDAMKEMVTHNPGGPFPNEALCYFWIYKEARFPAACPGPQVFAFEGDRIRVNVTNALDGPHAFAIPGMVDTGPIAPGATVSLVFEAGEPGTYLYHDNLNAPVNRVMGLHGAFVVMPRAPVPGHALTPYKRPTPAVQALYDDFGTAPWWGGLSWEAGDSAIDPPTPPMRQHVWLVHQASPVLFAEVGEWAQAHPGEDYPAADFVEAFVNDPFVATSNDPRVAPLTQGFNRKPHFFTMNGQSGHFAHHNASTSPSYRVGEPTLVRILNAGLWVHSLHLHANHFYVTAVNNVPSENPLWLDVYGVYPMDHVDYTIPFMRPPDVPNERGIGRADPGLLTQNGTRTWPPVEELERYHPPLNTLKTNLDGTGLVDVGQRQSPLCYPMHDHSEPTQVAQGGNYNCGLIAGIDFIGDRNAREDFPLDHEYRHILDLGRSTSATGPAAGEEPGHDAPPVAGVLSPATPPDPNAHGH